MSDWRTRWDSDGAHVEFDNGYKIEYRKIGDHITVTNEKGTLIMEADNYAMDEFDRLVDNISQITTECTK